MSIDHLEIHKKIVRQLGDAHQRSDRGRVAEMLSPRLVWHMAGVPGSMTRDDYLAGIDEGARAFADVSQELEQLIAEADKVVALSTWRMRHTGEFQGLAPTNRMISFRSHWMYRFVDDRIVEIWGFDEDFLPQLMA